MAQNTKSFHKQHDEVLVAIMNDKADFAILQDKLWYRIPVKSMPKPWPPKWLAFYQTKIFGDEAFSIRYYGHVRDIRQVTRRDLFPNEFQSEKTGKQYFQVFLDKINKLDQPILSARRRRLVFIPTTWSKFSNAVEINDLYHDSPLEDHLWGVLKEINIHAERQWDLKVNAKRYLLDFAVFCVNGSIDIETDGDTYHANPERAAIDNERNNDLTSRGWEVLRFTTKQVAEEKATYCVEKVTHTINRLGGLSGEGIVPRTFYNLPHGTAEQLTLFDEESDS